MIQQFDKNEPAYWIFQIWIFRCQLDKQIKSGEKCELSSQIQNLLEVQHDDRYLVSKSISLGNYLTTRAVLKTIEGNLELYDFVKDFVEVTPW